MKEWIWICILWIAEKIAIWLLELQWRLTKKEINNETRKEMAKETITAMEHFNRSFIASKGRKISEKV